jgi:hypothetical protein
LHGWQAPGRPTVLMCQVWDRAPLPLQGAKAARGFRYRNIGVTFGPLAAATSARAEEQGFAHFAAH